MGADINQYKVLEIKYIEGICYIVLDTEKLYIDTLITNAEYPDSDDEEFCKKLDRYWVDCLETGFIPIPIYKNGAFVNGKLDEKYRQKIEKIKNLNAKMFFFDNEDYPDIVKTVNCWDVILEINKKVIRKWR